MKFKKLIALPFICLTLTGCSTKTYSVEDYKLEMDYKDNFRICQLTDIHWGVEMDYNAEVKHLTAVINAMNNPDLIVITGDSFLDANTAMVKKFVKLIDSFNIPWTYTYGNHDQQGIYNYYYINTQIMKAKNSVFIDYKDDDLYGYTNFYINLKKDNKTVYRLYITDSNCYYNEGLFYGYDIIHQDQLDHIKAIDAYENDDATGIAFYHIPVIEFTDAADKYLGETIDGTPVTKEYEGAGERNEKECPGYKNSGAYDVFKEVGVKAMFIGHDHINDYDVDDGTMILSYGLKATDLVYHEDDMIGYQEITLPSDPSAFGLSSIKEVKVLYE